MTREYGKWPEAGWVSETIDWRKAERITAGVDVGTTSTQVAVLCDGELFAYANVRNGASFSKAVDTAVKKALGSTGMSLKDIGAVAATGFGRKHAAFAGKMLDEVHCHAKGARFMYGPEAHTVVDLGAQTVKAIRMYDWDRVQDIMMNDRCATGFGRNVEIICDLLEVPITEIGEKSLDVSVEPEPVSTTCFSFAQTETMGLFGRPEFRADALTVNQVYASHLFSIAWRILGVIGKLQPLDVGDIKVYKELALTGGLAKNPGITKRIERELQVTALESKYDPMLAGAIGAALLA